MEIEPNADLRVLDRAFLHGDIVARASDALGQQGVVVAVHVDVDLQFADRTRVRGVSSKRITQVRDFRTGHYVVHGSWVGRIEDVRDDVSVRFEDGAECVVVGADSDRLIPSENSSLFPDEEQCHFFAGLVVHGAPSLFRAARWTRGEYRGGRNAGVVSEVRPGTVTVDWLTGAGSDVNPPPTTMPARCLFPLSYYAHTCWQLGDRAIVEAEHPSATHDESAFANEDADAQFEDGVDPAETTRAHAAASDSVALAASVSETAGAAGAVNRGTAKAMERGGPKTSHARKARRRGRGANPRGAEKDGEGGEGTGASPDGDDAPLSGNDAPEELALVPPIRPTAVIVGTHTRVDVHWQDGTKTRRVLSRDLVPILHLGEHDFWPEQFVARREEADPDAGDVLGPGPDPRTRTEENENAAGSPNDLAAALGGVPVPDATPETLHPDPPYGVVETVNPVERIARVRWLPPDDAAPDPTRETRRWCERDGEWGWRDFGDAAEETPDARELVSVYELLEDGDYGYRLGDIVVRWGDDPERIKGQPRSDGETDGVEAASEPNSRSGSADAESDAESNAESDAESDASGSDLESAASAASAEDAEDASRPSASPPAYPPAPERCSLTWVGEVIAVRGGRVRVAWGSGAVSEVHPKFLLVVNQHEEEDAGSLLDADDFSDGVSSEASWETLSDGDADDAADGANRTTGDGARRRGVPEANPNAATRNALPGHMDPVAQAWVAQQRERAERDWLVEHQRRSTATDAGATDGGGGTDDVQADGREDAAPRAAEVSREDATRMAEEFAAAFRAAAATRENRRDEGGGGGGGGEGGGDAPADPMALMRSLVGALNAARGEAAPDEDEEDEDEDTSTPTDGEAATRGEDTASAPASAPVAAPASAPVAASASSSFPRFESVTEADATAVSSGGSSSNPAAAGALADHYYAGEPSNHANDRKWAKKITKEWAVLRDSLPESIWVRVYEDRMDCLRAAMVGPEGTPYHDNLFVFDFHFHAQYPAEPPAAHYHSFGLRVNPNLYENGKVCLSLLHTWQGKGSEVWNPDRSNMLQVLVSIQGLVLVDKPYYNEAGYEKQVGSDEGERNTAQYNEQAFLASAKSMLYLLRRPPAHFERLVRAHFKARGKTILDACAAYLNGCPVGAYEPPKEDEGGSGGAAAKKKPSRNTSPPSGGFKLMLEKLVPKLRAAFEENERAVEASEEEGERGG